MYREPVSIKRDFYSIGPLRDYTLSSNINKEGLWILDEEIVQLLMKIKR
jgi:hypothetical protein